MFKSTILSCQRLAGAAAIVAAALTVGVLCPQAEAVQKVPFSMEILVDGKALSVHPYQGKTYVEALRGREYTVRLRNHTGRRVAIALSVDGLNSIDAKTTTAKQASKWVLDPHQSTTIDGWQTSQSSARRFFFTTDTGKFYFDSGVPDPGWVDVIIAISGNQVSKFIQTAEPTTWADGDLWVEMP